MCSGNTDLPPLRSMVQTQDPFLGKMVVSHQYSAVYTTLMNSVYWFHLPKKVFVEICTGFLCPKKVSVEICTCFLRPKKYLSRYPSLRLKVQTQDSCGKDGSFSPVFGSLQNRDELYVLVSSFQKGICRDMYWFSLPSAQKGICRDMY